MDGGIESAAGGAGVTTGAWGAGKDAASASAIVEVAMFM